MGKLRFKHCSDIVQWINSSKDSTIYMCATIVKVMKKMPYLFLSGHHQVLDNFVIHYKMNCLFLPKFALAWERDIDISIQFFILIGGCRLGDVVDNESQMFYKFEDAK